MTGPLILVNPATGTFELTDLRSAQLPVRTLFATGEGVADPELDILGIGEIGRASCRERV